MAGDWIKIEHVMPQKPEVDAIADATGASVNEVVGGLVRLWIWADQQTIDGNAASVTKSAIDRHSGVTGLADAMLAPSVRWLVACETGGFAFPNFSRHNTQTGKQRALTSKRVAAFKQRKGNAKVTPGALPREEKRREDIKDTPVVPFKLDWAAVTFPAGCDTEPVRAAVLEWLSYRRAIKKPYKVPAKQVSLLLEQHGRDLPSAVKHSMANGWTGCFSDNRNKNRGEAEGESVAPNVDYDYDAYLESQKLSPKAKP